FLNGPPGVLQLSGSNAIVFAPTLRDRPVNALSLCGATVMVSVTRLFLCLLAMLTGMPVAHAAAPGQSTPVAQGTADEPASAIAVTAAAATMARAAYSHLIQPKALRPASGSCRQLLHVAH